MVSEFKDYNYKVEEVAKDVLEDNINNWVEMAGEGNAWDIMEELDVATHDAIDREFLSIDLHDCAYVLENGEVETDSGLWEGLDPIQAVESMAFFTFRNDVIENLKDKVHGELEDYLDLLESESEQIQNDLDEVIELREDNSEDYNEDEEDELTDEVADLDTRMREVEFVLDELF